MKLLNKSGILSLILIIITFTGCVSVYNPNPLNVPMLKEKGDVKLTVEAGNGFHGQFAAAIADEVGVIASAGFDSGSDTRFGSKGERKTSHYNVEAGLGYFTKLSESWIFEIYGGGGFGDFKDNKNYSSIFDASSNSEVTGKITKGFIQPAIGYNRDNFSISLAIRNVYLSLSDLSGGQENLHIGKGGWFIEPAVTMKLGAKPLKFVLQLGTSTPVNHSDTFNWEPKFIFGGIGVEFNLGEIFKSK